MLLVLCGLARADLLPPDPIRDAPTHIRAPEAEEWPVPEGEEVVRSSLPDPKWAEESTTSGCMGAVASAVGAGLLATVLMGLRRREGHGDLVRT